jgi:hypothetical protein|tara:strand:+ start:1506 stop:1700 length:195 start_codon:yes stop_codon:yes gene_type:complete
MKEYGYSYKQDSSNEILGYIKASSLSEAQQKLTIIKHLDIDSIDRVFKITEITSDEKQSRRYQR